MSIESVRKFVEKYGIGCFALLFLSFSISALTLQCGNRAGGQGAQENTSTPIATVAKFSATSDEIDGIVNSQRNSAPSFTATDEATSYGQALNNVLDHVYGLAFAASKGLTLDDKAVQEAIPSLWAQQVKTHRDILVQNHKLAPNASGKEFEDAFQKDAGHSLEEERQQFTDNFNTAFSDPQKKELIRSEVANQSLTAQYQAQTNVTDDDLKASYSTVSAQRISFEGKTGSEGQALVTKALADIKAGMSFEDAIKKYSTAKAQAGKSITDPIDISAQIAQYLPEYKPLFKLKQGEVSDPIDMNTGTSIFKIVKITQTLPPDFEKNKDQLRKNFQQQTASTTMMADLEKFKKANPPKWFSPAYQAVYDFNTTIQDPSLAPDKREAKLAEVETEAKNALKGSDGRVAALAYYAANNALYQSATPDRKKAMAPDRISALNALLQGSESPTLRLELADLYLATNDSTDAANQVKSAAIALTGTSVEDQKNYEGILAKLDKMKEAKKINDLDAKSIQGALDHWLVTMHQEDAMKLESERQDAENRKKNEELMKKNAADAAAAAAKAKSTAKPAAPITTPPKTNTAPPANATTGK